MPLRPPQHRPLNQPKPSIAPRASTYASGYDKRWERLRLVVLAERPLCEHCYAAGRLTAARDVHHIRPIRERPDLRLDPANLQPLCIRCHSRHTALESQANRRHGA